MNQCRTASQTRDLILEACSRILQHEGLTNLTLEAVAEERYASAHALMRRKYVDWQQKVENNGLDPARATLVRLAVDGLWFAEMHHYAPPNAQQRAHIIDLIFQLTYDIIPSPG